MKARTALIAGLAAAVASLATFLFLKLMDSGGSDSEEQREPLYWVAPMDPGYRRDGPGKSPMGMDLVPVYEEAGSEDAPGTVRVASSVVSNLGVRTEEIATRSLAPTLRTVGFVRWDEDRLTHEHPRVAGWIEELYVKAAGDPVRKGEPLYSLYSPDLVNGQEELLLALRRDDAALEQAARQRLSALHVPAELISAIEADGRVRRTVTFTATQDGIVDELPIREGFYVEPRTTLMAIGSLESIWVEATVLERQTAFVQTGMAAVLTADYLPDRRWDGRVDYVYPSLDPRTRTLRLRLRFDNPDRVLRPNMFTRVELRAAGSAPVPTVSREAVIRTGDGDRVVLALPGGRFRSVPVTLGAHDEQFFEVREGVEAGDRVVTSAQFLLDSESKERAGLERLSGDASGHSHPQQHAEAGEERGDRGATTGGMAHDGLDYERMNHQDNHGDMDHEGMDRDKTDDSR